MCLAMAGSDRQPRFALVNNNPSSRSRLSQTTIRVIGPQTDTPAPASRARREVAAIDAPGSRIVS